MWDLENEYDSLLSLKSFIKEDVLLDQSTEIYSKPVFTKIISCMNYMQNKNAFKRCICGNRYITSNKEVYPIVILELDVDCDKIYRREDGLIFLSSPVVAKPTLRWLSMSSLRVSDKTKSIVELDFKKSLVGCHHPWLDGFGNPANSTSIEDKYGIIPYCLMSNIRRLLSDSIKKPVDVTFNGISIEYRVHNKIILCVSVNPLCNSKVEYMNTDNLREDVLKEIEYVLLEFDGKRFCDSNVS